MKGLWIRKPQPQIGGTAIVFIHGILSSGETCWRNSNGAYWPNLVQAMDSIKTVGLYIYTYKTGFFSRGYCLGKVVSDLTERFRLDKINACSRVIFVCHSMGGIVARKFILDTALALYRRQTELGVFLVASPSVGSNYADWLAPIVRALGHRQAKALRLYKDNDWLRDLDSRFQELVRGNDMSIVGKELIEDTFIILKSLWSGPQIVEQEHGARYFPQPYTVPNSDHFTIVKPEDDQAIQHRMLCEFIENAISGREADRDPTRQTGNTMPTSGGSSHHPEIPFAAPIGLARVFEDREQETKKIADFLRDRDACFLTIYGRGGVGKTAIVYRLLRELESNQLSESDGTFEAGAIIYLKATPASSDLTSLLASGLMMSLDELARSEVRQIVESPGATIATKLRALLPHLSAKPTVVLFDNLEHVLSADEGEALDIELGELLRTLPEFGAHPFKIIITTRVFPKDLLQVPESRQVRLALSEGLGSPFAERVLRNLDSDGTAGLKTSTDAVLAEIAEATRGLPRALEAFFQILRSDPLETPEALLGKIRQGAHSVEQIAEALVGDAYKRLSSAAKRVVTILAVYGRPVPQGAIEYILHRWAPSNDGSVALRGLITSLFVRREKSQFYIHRIDQEYVLSRISKVDLAELFGWAADYWKDLEKPVGDCATLDDLATYFEEFRLRLEGNDAERAQELLDSISELLDRRGGFAQQLAMGRALAECVAHPDAVRSGLAHVSLALWRLGKIVDAISIQEQLVQLLCESDPGDNLLLAEGNLLILRKELGVTEELLQSFREFRNKLESSDDSHPVNLGTVLHNLANCLAQLGYLDESLEHQERALELAKEANRLEQIEAHTHNLGNVYRQRGDIVRAGHLYEEALLLADESGHSLYRVNHLYGLAQCARLEGRYDQALEYLDQTEKERLELSDLWGLAADLLLRAQTFVSIGDLGAASEAADRALRDARDLNVPLQDFYESCAAIALYESKLVKALDLAKQAIDLSVGEHWDVENLLGTILLRRGDRDAARIAFQRALDQSRLWLSRSTVNPDVYAEQGLALAGLVECGDASLIEGAREAYATAQSLCDSPGKLADWRLGREQLRGSGTFE